MKNWRGFATKIRGILRLSVARFSSAQLGGDGRIVCVDETFLTKKALQGWLQGPCHCRHEEDRTRNA